MFTNPTWQNADAERASPTLDTWAALYNLPRAIVYGLVAMESNFKPNAYRAEPKINDASYGLTQILLNTARGLGFGGTPADLYDPDTNVQYGLLYLRKMLDRFNSLDVALSAYNGGYRNNTITNPSYVVGVMDRANYFTQAWAASDNAQVDQGTLPTAPAEAGMPWWVIVGLGGLIALGALFGGHR